MLSLRILLTDLIDYAGIFPPSQLPMSGAVQRYAGYRRGDHFWILGRFILPLPRLGEFEQALSGLADENWRGGPWRVSVIGGRDFDGDVKAILDFNRRHAESGRPVQIEALELKVLSHEELQSAADVASDALEVYAEVPKAADADVWVIAAAEAGVRVKVRTGGVTADMFPSVADLASFITACARRKVGFRATSGLHHALRSEQILAAGPSGETATMHGFLNVFLAAAFAYAAGLAPEQVEAVLDERAASAFEFAEDGISWRDRRVTADELATVRRSFAVGYGACSFEGPVAELKGLGLLKR